MASYSPIAALWAVLRSGYALLFVMLSVTFAFGQSSSISGTVVDPQNNAVAGATVIATNAATGAARKAITSKEGFYYIPQLAPGTYNLRAEAQGFATLVQNNVDVPVSTTVTLNLVFTQVGAISETVTVQGGESNLNTSDATIGNTFTETQIRQLPLEGRNVVGLLAAQPGVVFVGRTDQQGNTTDYRNGSVNGGRSDQANVTLDGVDVNDQQRGLAFNSVLRVTLDSVQEFRVTTTNPNADQGRSSGAQVTLVTKSGSNSYHASAYEYHRNTVTTANDWFNNASGVERPKLLRNVFGATYGGPIVKDRFFVFLNYEGRRDRREDSTARVVPSADMRNGILKYNNAAGGVTTLDAAGITNLDPGRLGPSPAALALLQRYPLPNDFTSGASDGLDPLNTSDGINTFGYRFNAPIALDWNTYIARLDYNLTSSGRHLLFLRGNLQNDSDNSPPEFPGQPPRFINLNNSKGLAAGYTSQIKSSLTNAFRYGYTRQGLESGGVSSDVYVTFRNLTPIEAADARSNGRIIPVHNLADDVTWVKGAHTFGFGTNLRFVRNARFDLTTSFPNARANASWLIGTGVNLRPEDLGSGGAAFSDAMMMVLGIVPQGNARYNYDSTGRVLDVGEPVRRRFAANEYEWYGQDSWRIRPNLTISLGLRYGLYSPPWETEGNQVAPDLRFGDWFDLRGTNMVKGIPSNAAPQISYDLAGPANGRRGFYDWDKNNFAPRVAFAYSPKFESGWLKRLFNGGGSTSIRGGFSLAYDRVGSALAVAFDQGGSFGLSTALTNPPSGRSAVNAPRFTGFNEIPAGLLPAAPAVAFPSRFPGAGEEGSFAITQSIDDSLRTPYSMSINFSIQRELPRNFTFEAAYVGRFGRKLLTNADLAMPLDLYDPTSGDHYFSAANKLIDLAAAGTGVMNVPRIPYWENLYPAINANPAGIIGVLNKGYDYEFPAGTVLSATQVMYLLYTQVYSPDYTSALVDIDVGCGDPSQGVLPCSRFGPYALFNDQFSALSAWRSIGYSDYNSMQLLLRKRFSQGLQFDFNYTWSKSFDWASMPERQGSFSGFLVNSWNPGQLKAISDFDITHSINANYIYELPLGRGKYFGNHMNKVANALAGGWQMTGVFRWTSGLPFSVGNGRFWPTNWNVMGDATRIGPLPEQKTTKNAPAAGPSGQPGPNLFPDPASALQSYDFTRPGQSGERNGIRGDGYFTLDFGLGKTWKLTESHHLQFRWEVFNATNTVRFDPRSATLDLGSGADNFGKYSSTLTQPRVMQFALRYQF